MESEDWKYEKPSGKHTLGKFWIRLSHDVVASDWNNSLSMSDSFKLSFSRLEEADVEAFGGAGENVVR